MCSITNKINEIIDRRIGRNGFEGKGHLKAIRKKKAFFQNLKKALEEYQPLRENMLSQIKNKQGEYFNMSMEDPMLLQKIEMADPSATLLQLQKCLAECERLEKRFNRETINISVVGRARQGKSTLLQSISGLADEVIPASNGGDCTGAKSIIANASGKTHAQITFYNELEMVEQIQKYLDELGISYHLGSLSQVKSESCKDVLKAYEEQLKEKAGRQQSLFQHLKKYVEHYDDYCQFIGTVRDESDEKNIRNYVAQYDVRMRPTYAYLAVKEVQIFTEFPVKDAGKIVLVDTIGLGDTSLGIREKMIRTLRDDSDAAILVRLPAANGDGIRVEDDELYDLICEAMGTEALGKWLFFALNVCDSLGNQNAGTAMEEEFKKRKLNFAFIKKTDCGNRNDVEQNLLIPILQYLSTNLAEVDNNLMTHANEQFTDCFQKYYELCDMVSQVLSGSFRKSLQSGGLFDELYEDHLNLPRELKSLLEAYADKDKNGEKCDVINDNIKTIIRSIASHCPTSDMIEARLAMGGEKGHAPNVYLYYADNLRAMIRDEFEQINSSTITTLQEGLKKEVCELIGNDNGGRLKRVPLQSENNDDPVCWLGTLTNEKLNEYPLVAEAFNDIVNYKLNIEGFLEFKIDEALECLDYSPQNDKFFMPDFSGMSSDEIVSMIEQALQSSIPVVADGIINGIQELLLVPYHSFRARVRKLYDRLVMKEQGKRELKNFYREHAMAIWPNEFQNVASKEMALGTLNDCCNKLNEHRSKDLFILKLEN